MKTDFIKTNMPRKNKYATVQKKNVFSFQVLSKFSFSFSFHYKLLNHFLFSRKSIKLYYLFKSLVKYSYINVGLWIPGKTKHYKLIKRISVSAFSSLSLNCLIFSARIFVQWFLILSSIFFLYIRYTLFLY